MPRRDDATIGEPLAGADTTSLPLDTSPTLPSMEPAEFEQTIQDALDELPDWTDEFLHNVAILPADEDPDDPDLLGLYMGVPETVRGHEEPLDPPRILIFRKPLVAMCDGDLAMLREEIRITVLHEVAHHFGIDDDRLRELGYG
jgi:predicted Zn-dependent protease with MMP-like domain